MHILYKVEQETSVQDATRISLQEKSIWCKSTALLDEVTENECLQECKSLKNVYIYDRPSMQEHEIWKDIATCKN